MESRMEAYLNAAISGNTENLPNPISRIDFLLCELIKTLGESGASIEEVEKIVTDKVAEIVADAPEDFDTLKELSDWIYTHEESAAAMNTAIQTNTNSIESLLTDVNKKANSDDVYDKATADSRFLGIDATADKAVADENGSNISETFSTMKNDIAINRTTLGTQWQCKNLLKNNAVTKTVNGVTFTVNSDGSVTVNGTNTSSSTGANLEICSFKNYGTGKLTASLNSTDSNLYMSVFDKSWIGIGFVCDEEITWDNGNKERLVRLVVKPGATINNVTVYPMLRDAEITDNTYEAYTENVNERLIENKSNIAINKSTLGYQCKNLLKIVPRTITSGGVTCVIDDDGIVTVNGTASETVFINIRSNISLDETLEYTLTGTYDNSSYGYIYYQLAETIGGDNRYNDFGNGVIFKGTSGSLSLRIPVGTVLNNVKYYPMLRYADITDDTYEQYQPSLYERIVALEERIAALEV